MRCVGQPISVRSGVDTQGAGGPSRRSSDLDSRVGERYAHARVPLGGSLTPPFHRRQPAKGTRLPPDIACSSVCPPLGARASEEERDLTDEVRPSRRVRGGTRAAGRTAPDGVTESAAGQGAPPTAAADPGDEPTTRPWAPQATETAAVSDASEHPELLGTSRPADPRSCPFLRLERDGELVAPLEVVSDRHLCVALGEPRPQSERQQELLCLQAAHSNCARYLRGVANPEAPATRSRIPRPTVLAAVVLLASIGFSFGFVLQRGGLELERIPVAQSVGGGVPAGPDDRRGDHCVPGGLRPGRVDQPPPGRHRDRDRRADRHTAAADARPHRRPNAWPFAEPNAWPFAQPVAGADAERERHRDPGREPLSPRADARAHAAAHGDAPTHERPVRRDHQVPRAERLLDLHGPHRGQPVLDRALVRRVAGPDPCDEPVGEDAGHPPRQRPADPDADRRRRPAVTTPRYRATPASTPTARIPPEPARHAAHRATAGDVTSAVTRGVSKTIATRQDGQRAAATGSATASQQVATKRIDVGPGRPYCARKWSKVVNSGVCSHE